MCCEIFSSFFQVILHHLVLWWGKQYHRVVILHLLWVLLIIQLPLAPVPSSVSYWSCYYGLQSPYPEQPSLAPLSPWGPNAADLTLFAILPSVTFHFLTISTMVPVLATLGLRDSLYCSCISCTCHKAHILDRSWQGTWVYCCLHTAWWCSSCKVITATYCWLSSQSLSPVKWGCHRSAGARVFLEGSHAVRSSSWIFWRDQGPVLQ